MTSLHARPAESGSASGTISERISRAYPQFSGALRAFADYVLAEPVEVARTSIHGAVQSVGVSVATANRFARAIGFKGYVEFRAELISGFSSAFAPVEKLKNEISRQSTSAEIIAASISQDLANLEATRQILRPETCTEAVDLILRAERIYVVGIDNSAHLAGLLASGLGRYRPNVRSLSSADGAFGASRQLFRYGPADLVITIAFPRYFRDAVELSRFVKDRGVPLIAITDGPASPIAALTETVLYARAERQLASTSNASVLALLEGLVGAVAHRSPRSVEIEQQFASFALPWFEPEHPGQRKPRATKPAATKPKSPLAPGRRPVPVHKLKKTPK
jgi:DNA-binding MurR/RpiR family transcriptional regulator